MIRIFGICFLTIVVVQIINAEIENDPYSSTSLYERYPDYGKKWMFFPDGSGKPTVLLLEPDDDMILNETHRSRANDDELYVNFLLYTRQNPKDAYSLTPDDQENLKNSPFDPKKKTKFVTHGWRSNGSSDTCQSIKDAFLETEDANVVIVDWGELAGNIFYPIPLTRTRTVGAYYARLIDFLVDQGAETRQMHLVGHSLGAHISGVAGHKTTKGKINRISGLDPASPGFEYIGKDEHRLDPSDAEFVDVIHTCGGALGYKGNLGDVDVYPNGGTPSQPGCCCLPEVIESCSHGRSWQFFAESITSRNGFKAIQCDSWDNFKNANCSGRNIVNVGYPINQDLRGTFYTMTKDVSPFAEDSFLEKFNLVN